MVYHIKNPSQNHTASDVERMFQSLCKPPNRCKIKLPGSEVIFMEKRKDSHKKYQRKK